MSKSEVDDFPMGRPIIHTHKGRELHCYPASLFNLRDHRRYSRRMTREQTLDHLAQHWKGKVDSGAITDEATLALICTVCSARLRLQTEYPCFECAADQEDTRALVKPTEAERRELANTISDELLSGEKVSEKHEEVAALFRSAGERPASHDPSVLGHMVEAAIDLLHNRNIQQVDMAVFMIMSLPAGDLEFIPKLRKEDAP